MGWRKTQGDVQSGRVSFAKPKDNFKGFANAANIVAKSWMQDAADEKEAEKLRLKEEKAERKRIRNAQAAAEAKDKKLRSNATILAETYTGDPNNKAAVDYFYQQLVLKDGNIGSVETATQTRIENNQLEFTTGTTEPGLPVQGPNIPINPEIKGFNVGFGDEKETTNKDGREITVNDFPGIAEGNNAESVKAEASQMNEMFGRFSEGTILPGEVDEETGETVGPDIITPGGVKITPYGKTPAKIDFDRIKTLEDIELYEQEMTATGAELAPELQSIVDNRKTLLKGKSLKAKINTLAGDLEAARNQLQAAEVLQETDTDEYVAIKALVVSQENNLKPWETILEPNSFVGLDKTKLEQKRRVAKSLGAPDTKLTVLDAEIEALGKIVTDIKWSDITVSNFEGMAKEYEDKGREADAALIIEFGKAKQNPPMNNMQLDKSSDDLLAILSRETSDPEYKSRIDAVIAQKKLTADSTPIEFSKITKDNFEGRALELDAKRPEDAKRVRDYGRILNADKPLTLIELVTSDDIVLNALQNSVATPEYKDLINKAIRLKDKFERAKSIEDFNILDYDNVETPTIQAIIGADDTAPQNIVKLQVLLNSRNAQAPKIMAGSETFVLEYLDNGIIKTATAKLTEDGRYVDLNNPTKVVTPAPDTAVINLDLNRDLYADVVKITASTTVPLDKQREAMASTLESAKKLDDLVNPALGGDPAILTTVGGTLTPFMKRVGLEAATLVDLLNNQGQTVSEVSSYVDSAVAKYLVRAGNLTGIAKKAALFNAEKIKLAFSFAASALDQSGQGLSNDDFKYSLTVVSSGTTYDEFSSNLKSQTMSIINKTNRKIERFRNNAAINLLKTQNPTLFRGYDQTAEQYAVSSNLGDAFAWANGSASPPTSAVPTLQEFLDRAVSINPDYSVQNLTEFYNQKYGGSN